MNQTYLIRLRARIRMAWLTMDWPPESHLRSTSDL